MSTNDGDVVAILYEIGGRRDTHDARNLRRGDLADADPLDEQGPVPEAVARRAYEARKQARAGRRGGGGS